MDNKNQRPSSADEQRQNQQQQKKPGEQNPSSRPERENDKTSKNY